MRVVVSQESRTDSKARVICGEFGQLQFCTVDWILQDDSRNSSETGWRDWSFLPTARWWWLCGFGVCTVSEMFFFKWTNPHHVAGRGRTAVHLQDQVLMLLHFVAHQGKYGLLSDRFGILCSCYHRCVDKLLDIILVEALHNFISWPDAHRQKETADCFHAKCGFPRVIGSIDGTHITISRPPGEFFPEDYFSVRKKIYTMLLQVCFHCANSPPPTQPPTHCVTVMTSRCSFVCSSLSWRI